MAGPTQERSFLLLINAINTLFPCCNSVRLRHTFLFLTFPLFLEICHVILEKTIWQIKSLMGQTSLSSLQGKQELFLPLKNEKRTTVLLWYNSAFHLITVPWEMEKLNTAWTCLCSSLLSRYFQTYSTVSFGQLLKDLQEILYWFWFKNH